MALSEFDLSNFITRLFRTIQDYIRPDNPDAVPYVTQQVAFELQNPSLHLKDYDETSQLFHIEGHRTPHLGYALQFTCTTEHLPALKKALETWLQQLKPHTAITWAWLSAPLDTPAINNYQPKLNTQFIFVRIPLTSDVTDQKQVQHEVSAAIQTRTHLLEILQGTHPLLMSLHQVQTLQRSLLRFNPQALAEASQDLTNLPPFEINPDGSLSFPDLDQPWTTHVLSFDAFPTPAFNSAALQPPADSTDTFPLTAALCPQVAGLHLLPFPFYFFTHIHVCDPSEYSPFLQTTHTAHSCANSSLHRKKPWFHDHFHNTNSFSYATPQFKFQAGLICSAPEDVANPYIARLKASSRTTQWRLSSEPFLSPGILLQAIPFQYHDSYDPFRRASYGYFSHLFNLIGAPWASIQHIDEPPLPVTAITSTGTCPKLTPSHFNHRIVCGGTGTGKSTLTQLLVNQAPHQVLLVSSSTPRDPSATSDWQSLDLKPLGLFQDPDILADPDVLKLYAAVIPLFSPSSPKPKNTWALDAMREQVASTSPPRISWKKLFSTPTLESLAQVTLPRHTPCPNKTQQLFVPPLWQEQPSTQGAHSLMLALTSELVRTRPSILILDDLRAFDCPEMPQFFQALSTFLTSKKIAWTFFSRLPSHDHKDRRWYATLAPHPLAFLSLPEQSLSFLVDTDLLDDAHSLETCRQLEFTPSSFDIYIPHYTTLAGHPRLQPGPQPCALTLHLSNTLPA